MRKEIKIGTNISEYEINALTPILYKKAFKTDFIRELQSLRSGKNSEGMAEFFPQIAFVALKQAKHDYKITEDEFYTWLGEFGALDFANAAPELLSLIMESDKTSSKAKN